VGHGSPENALLDNAFTRTLSRLGQELVESHGKPEAVMVVSAHWITEGPRVGTQAAPKQIYDFGGFPDELYEFRYEPPGHPRLAAEAVKALTRRGGQSDEDWGTDHAAWTLLSHIFPEADVPVFELGLDLSLSADEHAAIAADLAFLREEGVLILGSGNITHNLRRVEFSGMDAPIPDWARDFDEAVDQAARRGDKRAIGQWKMFTGSDSAVPTPDHYLPLVYFMAVLGHKERAGLLYRGFQYGSISMRSYMSVEAPSGAKP
jgi:4,5-DOPA dioxygenase extradiol